MKLAEVPVLRPGYSFFLNQYNSSVGIMIKLRSGRPRIRGLFPGRGKIFFSSPQPLDRLWLPHCLLSNGIGAVSPGVNWLGHEAVHSAPSSAEIKNCGAITLLPHMSSWRAA
jgi:hypothetical protein